jgi:hypothetical protein
MFKKVNDTYLSSKDKSLRLATHDLFLKLSSNYNNNKLNSNPISINVNRELCPIKRKRLSSSNNLIYKKRKRYFK